MLRKRVASLLLITLFLAGCSGTQAPTTTELPSALPTIAAVTPTAAPTAIPLPLVPNKGPYLVMTGDPTSLKICWQMEPPADVVLTWGTNKSYAAGSIALPASGAAEDVPCALLEGLQSATHYLYRLQSRGAESTGSFTTPPGADAANLVFWGFGDTQENPQVHDAIASAILAEMGSDPARQTFVFNTGDVMNEASEDSLQFNQFDPQWTNLTRLNASLPIVNTMGNHDGTKLFIKYYPYPYSATFDWSFDYGPAHFVVIDLYSGTDENSPRWQWLRDDLAASTKPWKFILMHEPGWSAGPHENNAVVQQIIHPIAVRYGVAIIFSGHNHYYARASVDGVTYITTGGGGSPLYDPEYGYPNIVVKIKSYHYLRVEISGNTLTVTALSPQGAKLDQFQISH